MRKNEKFTSFLRNCVRLKNFLVDSEQLTRIHRIKGLPGSMGTLITDYQTITDHVNTDYLLTTTSYKLPLTNNTQSLHSSIP
jgi:hypothetical protein